VGLVCITLAVVLFVLVPYYGSGMVAPSAPPGMVPTMPFEWDAIARFNGTLWESTAWQDAFWNVGCNAWGLWCLSVLPAVLETRRRRRTLSRRGLTLRLVVLGLNLVVGLLWLVAAMGMFSQILD
jgi:hypothetical protein